MTLHTLLIAYIFGGLTFLPLLAITILTALWYTSPKIEDVKSTDDTTANATITKDTSDGAASATFAVLRRYDFQGATAAFKEAASLAAQAEANADKSTESMSVYQSMYRSVFDRKQNAANPLQEEQAQETVKARARGKVFYIVLRHGHLMLYDSQIQLEVRHVISLAHYTISLQDDIFTDPAEFLDANLFTKRTSIVLTPTKHFGDISTSTRKPFYLFCNINTEKEDFYHALLSSMADPPIPKAIDTECAIKLQSALHSTSLSLETRAINALMGRIFLGTHRTPFLEAFIREKIEKKIARIQKPAFIASIACHSITLGDAAPIISNLRLKDINVSGDTLIALDLKYTGGLNLTIAATAKLDLGQRFKTRMVSLLLAVVMQRIQGKMLVRIKPPPSNRIWFCFETMPEMELKIEPVVSSRQITYAFVLRAIETRIREAFAEGMVKPNWDDVPFFTTTEQLWRGGIWESEGRQEEEKESGEVAAENALSIRDGKSMSTPALGVHEDDTSIQTSYSTDNLDSEVNRRSSTFNSTTTSDSAQSAADRAWQATRAPKSLRSPSFATPKAVVAVDDSSADAIRGDDASIAPKRRWGRQGQVQQKRDAAEVVRQVRDRDTLGRGESQVDETSEDASSMHIGSDTGEIDSPRRASEPDGVEHLQKRTMTGFGSTTLPRTNSKQMDHARNGSQDSGTPKRTILASTAAATNAAKQWTWNAVANRANRQQIWKNGLQRQGSKASNESDSSEIPIVEPVGRGQPLPPPGVPLPGPSPKGLWNAAAAGLGGMRRKPVPRLPPRRQDANTVNSVGSETTSTAPHSDQEAEGEFGPWMANDDESIHARNEDEQDSAPEQTDAVHNLTSVSTPDIVITAAQSRKKPPPPLPPRRRAAAEEKEHDIGIDSTSNEAEATTTSFEKQDILHDMSEQSQVEGQQSVTPPDLIDLEDDSTLHDESELDGALDTLHDESELDEALDTLHGNDHGNDLHDDIQAIPAPVDAEAEESGILDMADHIELPEDIAEHDTKALASEDTLQTDETTKHR